VIRAFLKRTTCTNIDCCWARYRVS